MPEQPNLRFMGRLHSLFLIFTCICLLLFLPGLAQDTASTQEVSSSYPRQITERLSGVTKKLDGKTKRILDDFRRHEEKLHRKLSRLDSNKAKEVFDKAQVQYNALLQKLQNPGKFSGYIAALDTLKTSLSFLSQNGSLAKQAAGWSQQLTGAQGTLTALETELQKAELLKTFLRERREYLVKQLQGLGLAKHLGKLHKQAYYYSAQIREYRELLKDPSKIERKALELLSKTKAFQDFMRKNSQLASMFRVPGGEPDPAALQGLQTRAQVAALIRERIGPGGEALVRENVQAAQAQLSSLRNQAEALGQGRFGTASDSELPDFRPNHQKTKSLRQRLELGTNLQTKKGNHYFPITSDIGLSLGYKLNDKSIVGLGASYKLGLGTGWNNIAVTHQGLGLRSFVDYRLKGSLYISGGYEQNYLSRFHSIDQLRDYSAWQSSGLVGVSRRFSVSKKLKGEMKLLWDFLSYRQVPRSQAVLFRVGYSLK